jgi:hypothetical protein
MIIFNLLLIAGLLSNPTPVPAQQAPQPAPAAPSLPGSSGQGESSSARSSGKSKSKPVPSFLIVGTVFDEKALSLPGVQVRIRQAGEKKFRWETYTNSRGEFAVRVPPGYQYEVVTHVKSYEDQTHAVDSKTEVQQRLSIQLERRGQTKTGAKP